MDRGSLDRKSTRLNSSHGYISYAVFCLKKKRQARRSDSYSSDDGKVPAHTTAARERLPRRAPVFSPSINDLLSRTHSFFFNDTATTEIYTLSLHDALPISGAAVRLHFTYPGHSRVPRKSPGTG